MEIYHNTLASFTSNVIYKKICNITKLISQKKNLLKYSRIFYSCHENFKIHQILCKHG